MSFYATISGYLTYSTIGHLDAAVHRLITGKWLNDNGDWIVDGNPDKIQFDSTIDRDRNLLVIPPGHYRNLARITTELFAGATDGLVVTSSIDGCFDAWIETPLPESSNLPPGSGGEVSSIRCIDLEKFARAQGLGMADFDDPNYFEWQDEVIQTFHDQYDPDVFSILSSGTNLPPDSL